MTHALYALPHSLYSGRARSYLIKNNIPFQEFSCGHESYKAEIVAEAKLATIPVLRTEEGQVIRDGAAIIEYFEAANGRPCLPATPKQQIISGLFDLIGAEGLLRPAHRAILQVAGTPEALLAAMRRYRPPVVEKWIGRGDL